MILEATIVFLIALTGGCLPLFFRWSERLLHVSLALSTGIFLGAVFFHLLPALAAGELTPEPAHGHGDASEVVARGGGALDEDHGAHPDHDHPHAAAAAAAHSHGDTTAWIFVLIGVLGVYLVESLILRSGDHDDLHRHRGVSFAALVGLSLHSLTAGLAYPAVTIGQGLMAPIFIAIISHKGLEAFSLTTVFQLAEFRRGAILAVVIGFSLVTPVGMLAGNALADRLTPGGVTILSALAAGTFLYVCIGELLPEVFHHREDSLAKIGLMAVGIVSMLLLHGAGA